jgi:hypothetical protein
MVETSYRLISKKIHCHACNKKSSKLVQAGSDSSDVVNNQSEEAVTCEHCESPFIEFIEKQAPPSTSNSTFNAEPSLAQVHNPPVVEEEMKY